MSKRLVVQQTLLTGLPLAFLRLAAGLGMGGGGLDLRGPVRPFKSAKGDTRGPGLDGGGPA